MKKIIDFNKFASFLTGSNNREEQINTLKDSLISVKDCEEISECELLQMFDKKCEISQTLEPFHNFYTIRINNIWECDSVLKIL